MALIQWKQIDPHLSGSGILTGSLNLSGSQNISGDLIVSGGKVSTSGSLVSFDNIPWPEVGEEAHLFKTQPFSVNISEDVSIPYDYLGIALEHKEYNSESFQEYHNSITFYAYDNHVTPNYGTELNISPLINRMRVFASGSDSIANVSVEDLLDGRTQALVYGDVVQIGQYLGRQIGIGNSSASIDIYGKTYFHEDVEITGSTKLSFDGITDYFAVSVNGEEKLRINEEGTVVFSSQAITPTAVQGGMFYSSSDAYFLGFDN